MSLLIYPLTFCLQHQQVMVSQECSTSRDQPNSREKTRDFTAEFLKCVKFHGKFTEKVSQIHEKFTGPQTLFRGAALLQTKKFQNNEYLLH